MNDDGFRSFQDLSGTFKLSLNSFFLYLQLHSALRAAGILTDRKPLNHPIMELFRKLSRLPKRYVSVIYNSLLEHMQTPLVITNVWNKDCPESSIDWHRVWRNYAYSTQNLNNKLTNLNFLYRTYLTPNQRFMIKLSPSPNYNLCDLNQIGTFLHITWECPTVQNFWQQIVKHLYNALGLEIDLSPKCVLLNDDSGQNLNHFLHVQWLKRC